MRVDKRQKLSTRIIAGKYKGRVLYLPSLGTTRASKSILKESFFNVIQFDINDSIFIEAFGGSGSIGLEAISRSASASYFIEKDKKTFGILSNNCTMIDKQKTNPIFADTFDELPLLLDVLKSLDKKIILYIDPPFDFRDGMENIYNKCFDMIDKLEHKNLFLIVYEHLSSIKMPKIQMNLKLWKTKKFGKSSLSYYKALEVI